MRNVKPIVDHLHQAQVKLLRAADVVPAERWATRPSPEAWSAAELIAHLIMVERAIVGNADRIRAKPPRPIPFLKRLHLPMALVESRLIRRKTPIPLDTNMVREKEQMLAELREVRERSLAFLTETREQDLRKFCWPHPFLGMLNTYDWFKMIGSHEIRHTKQMNEIASNLPKLVATGQKRDEFTY